MSGPVERAPRPRAPLHRERVLRGAMTVADREGLGALTIRSIAHELGVKPMSLYHHVTNKDDILDGIVDLVFAEIELPEPGGDWRQEMVRRANSARAVLRRHSWAIGLMESRSSPGPATLRHHDAVIGTLRGGGFSVEMTAHAYALVDSYTYGFALQESALPFESSGGVQEVADTLMPKVSPTEYPHFVEMVADYYLRPEYSFGDEFEFGLGLILDALGRSMTDRPSSRSSRRRKVAPQSG